MTVREYNDWVTKNGHAYAFVRNINDALDKAGEEAKLQMQCIGWSEEMEKMLIDGLEALRKKKLSLVYKTIARNKRKKDDEQE